jgi:exodeoxyribonuclease VII large subunit
MVFPESAELEADLAERRIRLRDALSHRMDQARRRLDGLAKHRALAEPVLRLRQVAQDLDRWEERAALALTRRARTARERLSRVAGHLDAVSPLAVLSRGYSITRREGEREALRGVEGVGAGDRILTRLAGGSLLSEVVQVVDAVGEVDAVAGAAESP